MKTMKYIGTAALLALATACTNDDHGMDTYHADPNAVRIHASVGEGIPVTRSYPTDDTKQGEFKTGDAVMVSAGNQPFVAYTRQSGGTWAPADPAKYLKWEENSMTFKAYYPAGANGEVINGASLTTFTLPAGQSTLTALEKADYMIYTDAEPISKTDNVPLPLQRKTARVIVHIEGFKDQYATGYEVTGVMVNGNTNGYDDSQVRTGDISVSSYPHENGDFYALLTPTTVDAAATFLTLTVKPTDAAAEATGNELTVKGIPAMEAGQSYTYNIIVGKDMAKVSSVEVKDWGEETLIGEVGEAESYFDMEELGITTKDDVLNQLDKYISNETLAVQGSLTNQHISILKEAFSSQITVNGERVKYNIDLSKAEFSEPLEEGAFAEMYGAKGIIMPPGLKELPAESFFGSHFEFIELPESLEKINGMAFSCPKLKKINIDKTQVTIIDAFAFNGCFAESIALGNVTRFRSSSFRKCPDLRFLDLSKCEQVPILETDPFFLVFVAPSDLEEVATKPSQMTVYVKDEAMKTQFEADNDWRDQGFTADNFVVKP